MTPKQIQISGKVAQTFFNRDGTWRKSRYKILHGGRGSSKSRGVASVVVGLMRSQRDELVLCTREYQNSIARSVHKLLAKEIERQEVSREFDVQQFKIVHKGTRSESIFFGMHHTADDIKSTEGITKVWIEEGRATSEESINTLFPTIRAPESEIWCTFNPELESDPMYREFVHSSEEGWTPRPGSVVTEVNWRDNPWFTPELEEERRIDFIRDRDAYDWKWEGKCRRLSQAAIFRDRWFVTDFDEPTDVRPRYGVDFGFADDPATCIRCYVYADPTPDFPDAESLFVTHEAFGKHIETDDLALMIAGGTVTHGHEMETRSRVFPGIPGAATWPLMCDGSKPEQVSALNGGRHGRPALTARAAAKWPGSVEDGLAHLKAYRRILIRPSCVNLAREFRLYAYKVDRISGDVLPTIVDKHNHGIDALRYALDGVIQRAGIGRWVKMAGGSR